MERGWGIASGFPDICDSILFCGVSTMCSPVKNIIVIVREGRKIWGKMVKGYFYVV